VHDILGALTVLRKQTGEIGQDIRLPVSDGKKFVQARIQAQEKEKIRTPAGPLVYKGLLVEGYLGALIGDSPMQIGVSPGQPVELGREPKPPGMFLPDRGTQDNIQWLAGPRAQRAAERGFTLDKVLTGRHQALISAEDGIPVVTPLHETCPTIMLDELGRVTRLSAPARARIGDVLLLGTAVVALREPLA
jgi:hypothetical protein